ncbi:DCL family protein [Hahella sp. CR1]|uniref:DCL family protein n=1 Tax=Hahella sp. CR1 TaxID=2992807 RepID=UPI0024430F6C|nr:DCL family protein [Hahella sp. CR1]MDG9670591.1 DCL family protein [Hahella sp. CR1]
MAKPIAFGAYQFKTKKSATEEARKRINHYKFGERLRPDDEHFFVSLFTLHPEYSSKKGAGIDYIIVKKDFHNKRCLYIHRIDGTEIDCSWVNCIQPASQKAVVSMAFRRAVKEIIAAYRRTKLNEIDVCPILGIKLTYDNSHVSYLPPSFDKLLTNFLDLYKINIESISLTNPNPSDTDQRGQITDKDILKNWQSYHHKHAKLQLLSAEANLRREKS